MKQPQGTVSGKWRLRRQCGGTQRCGCWEVAESEEGAQIAHVRGKAAAAQGLSEGDRTRMQGSWGKGITAFEGKKAAESTGNTGPELTLGASCRAGSLMVWAVQCCSHCCPQNRPLASPFRHAFNLLSSGCSYWPRSGLCAVLCSLIIHILPGTALLASVFMSMYSFGCGCMSLSALTLNSVWLLRFLSPYPCLLKLPESLQFLWQPACPLCVPVLCMVPATSDQPGFSFCASLLIA